MGVRTTHAWRLGGFNPACHSGWLLYDNTKGLSIGGVCFFAIALQEHWNRLIARVFSNGADTSSPQKQTNKQCKYLPRSSLIGPLVVVCLPISDDNSLGNYRWRNFSQWLKMTIRKCLPSFKSVTGVIWPL